MRIIKKILKWVGIVLISFLLIVLLLLGYVNLPAETPDEEFSLGMTFSTKYSGEIGIDWKEIYLAMLDDLEIKRVRLPVYWDDVEAVQGEYDFSNLDWQVARAEERGTELIIVVGRKVPRWPECFIPEWAKEDQQLRRASLLKLIRQTVERYKDSPAVEYWQVENEPFLAYGQCPPFSKEFLDTELALVRSLDPSRQVIVTDSGELSLWIPAASRADVFGTTMYRKVFTQEYGAYEYPVGPRFFQLKKKLLKHFAGNPRAIVIELQGEPWLAGATVDFPVEDQLENLDAELLKENVEFARQSGFNEIYLWGVEWWYWMKTTQGNDTLWEAARELYSESE